MASIRANRPQTPNFGGYEMSGSPRIGGRGAVRQDLLNPQALIHLVEVFQVMFRIKTILNLRRI